MHLVSSENEDVVTSYDAIRKELADFDSELTNKTEIVLLSKSDMADDKDLQKRKKLLEKHTKKSVQTISLYDDSQIKAFSEYFLNLLEATVLVEEVQLQGGEEEEV